MRAVIALIASAALIVITSTSAHAQQQRLTGIVFGAHMMAMDADAGGLHSSKGAAAGVFIGYGISEHVAVILTSSIGGIDTDSGAAMLGHSDLGLRVFPVRLARFAPYAELMFSARGRDAEPDMEVISTGASVGIGMDVMLRRGLSLDISFIRMRGTYPEDFQGDPIPAAFTETTRRLQVGLSWRAP